MPYVNNIGVYLFRGLEKFYPSPKFGKFLILEDTKNKIFQAAKRKEDKFPELVTSYVFTAFLIPKFILENLRWEFLFSLFSLASNLNKPSIDIPLLKPHKTKDKKEEWDYEGRGHSMYVHIFSKNYGWTLDYINNLDLNFALQLAQEIITDEQLDREFLWNMSDKSYIYDYKTKSGKPNPLERPYFMKEEVKPPVMMKIPAYMLPEGVVDYGTISKEFQPRPVMRGL